MLITLHYATLHYPQSNYTTLHSIELHKLQVQLQLQLKNNYNYTTLHYTILHYTTILPHYTTLNTLHYTTLPTTTSTATTILDYPTIQYTTLIKPRQIRLQLRYTSYTTLQLQLELRYTTLHQAVVGEVATHCNHAKKSQLQQAVGPSVDSLCHPCFTTTKPNSV